MLKIYSITCEENQIGVRFIKVSEGFNETWVVKSTNFVTLYQSWMPGLGREEREVCLPVTSNSQYIVDMTVSAWGWNSYLEIIGPYGNTIFKAVWYDFTYYFSLLMPILKNDTWKWSTELTPLWYESQIDTWEDSISGEYEKTSNTHYFTIPFYGEEGMAAYEVKFYYRYGIVAYINGVEIYRDHMPSGLILPTTKSTAQYSTYDYYGTIRNGHEVSSPNNILAVEIHTSSSTAIRFDGWMAIYQLSDVSVSTLKCHPIQPIAAHSNLGFDLSSILDWNVSTGITMRAVSPGIDYFEYTVPTSQPNYLNTLLASSFNYIRTMRFSHIDLVSGEATSLYDGSATLTGSNEYKNIRMGNQLLPNVNKFRVYPTSLTGTPTFVIEQLPRVCNIPYSMGLTHPEYKDIYLFTVGDVVDISPKNWDRMTTCTSIPQLPEGLTFNKCGIQGSPAVATENITYTIMALDSFGTKVLSFQLGVMPNGNGDDDGSLSTMVIIIIVVVVIVIALVVVLLYLLKLKPRGVNPRGGVIIEDPDPNPSGPGTNPNPSKPVVVEMTSSETYDLSIPRQSTSSKGDPYRPSLGNSYGNPLERSTPGYNVVSTPGYNVANTPATITPDTPGYSVANTPATITPDTPGYSVANTPATITPDTPGYNRYSPMSTLGGSGMGGYSQATIHNNFQMDNMSMMGSISQPPQYNTYNDTLMSDSISQSGVNQGLSLLHGPMGGFPQDSTTVLMSEDPLKAPAIEDSSILAQSSNTSGLVPRNSNDVVMMNNSTMPAGAPSTSSGVDNGMLILEGSTMPAGAPSTSSDVDNSMLILDDNMSSISGQDQPTANNNPNEVIFF